MLDGVELVDFAEVGWELRVVSNRDIAARLVLSVETVKDPRSHILRGTPSANDIQARLGFAGRSMREGEGQIAGVAR
jgi:hypothetical protein